MAQYLIWFETKNHSHSTNIETWSDILCDRQSLADIVVVLWVDRLSVIIAVHLSMFIVSRALLQFW